MIPSGSGSAVVAVVRTIKPFKSEIGLRWGQSPSNKAIVHSRSSQNQNHTYNKRMSKVEKAAGLAAHGWQATRCGMTSLWPISHMQSQEHSTPDFAWLMQEHSHISLLISSFSVSPCIILQTTTTVSNAVPQHARWISDQGTRSSIVLFEAMHSKNMAVTTNVEYLRELPVLRPHIIRVTDTTIQLGQIMLCL